MKSLFPSTKSFFRVKFVPLRFAVSMLLRVSIVSLAIGIAFAADAPAADQILPTQFGGWQMTGSAAKSSDAAAADAANGAVLKEYGFERFEKAEYTREDGRKLTIKAAVFGDASGAYGAFTFYRIAEMNEEKIGALGSSFGNRVLFFQGNVLVDAVFDRLTAMSAAELRELAGMVPQPRGSVGKLPPLRSYLPLRGLAKNSEKYAMGPLALDALRAPLASSTVDFSSDTEVVFGRYPSQLGEATLMLIEYPTPQIAIAKLKQIDEAHQATAQQPGAAPIVDVGPFFDKRTGPIVVIAAGPLSRREADALMGPISYDADVTWNENTYATRKDNLANLLFNVIILCGVVIGLALVVGVGFGGVRILLKKMFPGRVFDRPEEMEIISLHLEDQAGKPGAGR